jgi:hypothetical protein
LLEIFFLIKVPVLPDYENIKLSVALTQDATLIPGPQLRGASFVNHRLCSK